MHIFYIHVYIFLTLYMVLIIFTIHAYIQPWTDLWARKKNLRKFSDIYRRENNRAIWL